MDLVSHEVARLTTRELLAEYVVLINRHGPDSPQAAEYLEKHKDDAEFVELAETSRWLKLALTAENGCAKR